MKKLLAVCILVGILFSFSACGSSSTNNTTNDISISNIELATKGTNVIDGVAEFEILNIYESNDVVPPKPSSVYSHYEADSGNTYMVILMNVKNTGSSEINIDNMFELVVSLNNQEYTSFAAVETNDSSDLDRYYSIKPLEVARTHYLVEIPANSDLTNVDVRIESETVTFEGVLNIDSYSDYVKTLTVGEPITDNETIEITLKRVFTTEALYPPNASGYYTYFEASSGNIYWVMEFNVKNLKSNDMGYDTIAGVTGIYNDKYRYSSFPVFTENNGADLSQHTSIYALAPLESNTVYYLLELPKETENSSVKFNVYVAGQDYTCTFS